MSSLSAQQLRFADRGLLRSGYAADIVIFEAKIVSDQATCEAPHDYAAGFSCKLVNGVLVVEKADIPENARGGCCWEVATAGNWPCSPASIGKTGGGDSFTLY